MAASTFPSSTYGSTPGGRDRGPSSATPIATTSPTIHSPSPRPRPAGSSPPAARPRYRCAHKTRAVAPSAPAEPVPADVLVLESTFGKPHYRFPDAGEVLAAVVSWCKSVLDGGATPVLLGYSLGKGQEILSALAAEGFTIALHPSSFGVTEVYRELGCDFPPYRRLGEPGVSPTVVITPPSARRHALMDHVGEFKTAALT